MTATLPAMRPVLDRTLRLGASALFVTLLAGWAWFGEVDRDPATGMSVLAAQRPDRVRGAFNVGWARPAAPTPGLVLVGAAEQISDSRPDGIGRIAPRLASIEPLGSAVAVSAPIVMSFSEPMARASVEGSFAIRPQVEGTLTWADDFTLRFRPYVLAHGVTYEVQVRGRSVRGMPSAGQLRWSFTTVAGPPLVNLPGRSTIKVPILMYHYIQINPDPRDWLGYALSITPSDFAVQMDWLARNGYHPITAEDLYSYLNGTRGLPSRPVILSFDDGYADFFTTALPILRSHDFTAVAYVVSGFVGRPGYMTAAEVVEADRSGIEIGSHTVTHADLARTSADGVRIQLTASKQALEQMLGHPVVSFCYPSGRFNASVASAVAAAGYHDATTTGFSSAHALTDRYVWGRVRVSGGESLNQFASALLSAS
jgi:peptidoglycan/xylan/chitin deacetylase (PgdA/CDA1 family)